MPHFRRFRSGRRSGGRKQIPRWTAQADTLNLTAAAPTGQVVLYNPGTTIGAGQYEEESKLVRLVGRLCVRATDNGTVLPGPVGIGIIKSQSPSIVSGGFQDPFSAAELAARDWLRVLNVEVPPQSGPNAWLFVHDIDTKIQRRLKAEDAIRLVTINGTGDDITISIDIRILIVIRM